MASNYPTSIDSFTDPLSNSPLNNPSHAAQHQDVNDAVEKLETKLGVGSSPASGAASGHVLVANGSGSTTWQAPAVTAAQFANVGLTFITSTTVQSGSGIVTVSNCFSSTYDNYKIIMTGGTHSSGGANLALTLGSANSGYYSSIVYYLYTGGSAQGIGTNNGASFPYAGIARTNWSHMNLDIFNPFASQRTTIGGPFINVDATGNYAGFLDNANSYSSFTLTPNNGTLTGQIITVYGYRKA